MVAAPSDQNSRGTNFRSAAVRFRGRIPTQKRNVFMGQNFQRPSGHTWHKSNHNCIHTFRPKSGIWPGARVKWPSKISGSHPHSKAQCVHGTELPKTKWTYVAQVQPQLHSYFSTEKRYLTWGSCEVTHRRYKSFVRLDSLYKKTSTMTLEISFSSFRIPGRSKRNAHFLVFGESRYTKLESVFEGSVGRESDFLVFSPLGTL